ncbi:3-oxoacyl-ACP reductase FabG [Duodenibacillus massiliensis]|uniref:3-oxoacyl-ACP reductase FabG n=1 Tax=Duodenibacillus massiliensis TaxID=1852381 RepID=UPI003AB40F71
MLINADAFAGRVALVTGASRGIGAAVAKKLTEAGAFAVGTATSEKGAEAVSAALGEKGRGIVLNVTDRAACAEAVNAVVTEFGRIDILVNNAGITRDMLAMRLSDEDWDAVIATNLTSVFTMTRACLRPMIKARYGRIINMSSVVAQMGNAGQANYAAAKAGIIGMSKSVAQEVASRGITVNCITPGFIETDMTKALPEETRKALSDRIPAKRLGQTDDIAGAVLFLASDLAGYVTGAVLPVNGGLFMG